MGNGRRCAACGVPIDGSPYWVGENGWYCDGMCSQLEKRGVTVCMKRTVKRLNDNPSQKRKRGTPIPEHHPVGLYVAMESPSMLHTMPSGFSSEVTT